MKFYRYDATPKTGSGYMADIVLRVFEKVRETPKGFWITDGFEEKWVSNSSKKRFAYPTENKHLNLLSYQRKGGLRFSPKI